MESGLLFLFAARVFARSDRRCVKPLLVSYKPYQDQLRQSDLCNRMQHLPP